MIVFANSTGNRFGAVCLGSKISPNLTPAGREELFTDCGTIGVKYEDNELTPGSALYREFSYTTTFLSTLFSMFVDLNLLGNGHTTKNNPIFEQAHA